MRWRQSFMAEVHQSLQQLGMRACPVCGSAESLGMSPFPMLLVDGKFPSDAGDLPVGEDREGDLTFAIRVDCVTCGHLMLFDSARYRTGDERSWCSAWQGNEKVNAKSDCHLRRPLRSPLVSARYIPGDGLASAHAEADTVAAAATANPVAKPLGNA